LLKYGHKQKELKKTDYKLTTAFKKKTNPNRMKLLQSGRTKTQQIKLLLVRSYLVIFKSNEKRVPALTLIEIHQTNLFCVVTAWHSPSTWSPSRPTLPSPLSASAVTTVTTSVVTS